MASEQLAGGFGCATSVLLAFCDDYDLDSDIAARLSCGLGGGCASGEICGAASGAILVIGLKLGQESAEDASTKANCRTHVVQFLEKFKEQNGALTCRDLLGCDTSTEEGFAIYLEKRETVCFGAVKSAVGILEESGY
jgi:C_GCAxxG_C_C family probable redox protein